MSDIMQAHKIPEGMIWKRIRLAFLSPKLLQAIVEGTTNRELSIKMLTKHDLPVEWSEQEALFLGWVPCYGHLNSLLIIKAIYENPNKRWGLFVVRSFPNIKKQKIPC